MVYSAKPYWVAREWLIIVIAIAKQLISVYISTTVYILTTVTQV